MDQITIFLSPFYSPRVFPILWTLVCPLIDETSRAKFLFYATDGQRGDQLAAQSAGLRWGSWRCSQKQVRRLNFNQGLSARGQDPWLAGRTCPDSDSRGWPRPQVLLHVQPGAFFSFWVKVRTSMLSIFKEFEKDQSPGPHLIENYHSLSLNKGQVTPIAGDHVHFWNIQKLF